LLPAGLGHPPADRQVPSSFLEPLRPASTIPLKTQSRQAIIIGLWIAAPQSIQHVFPARRPAKRSAKIEGMPKHAKAIACPADIPRGSRWINRARPTGKTRCHLHPSDTSGRPDTLFGLALRSGRCAGLVGGIDNRSGITTFSRIAAPGISDLGEFLDGSPCHATG